ncbi:MAG: hypothetical protein KDJ77_16250, partial [Rhodobiaceae bacterium]|nr:hypothetical protein [Rhodobiaceae bacterium]
RPFRYQPHFPTAMLPAGIAAAFVVGMGVSNVLTDPFAPTPIRELPVVNANLDCARSPATAFCSADILVIGDSQAAMYTPAVRAFGRRHDLKVAQSVAPGCTPTFGARMISGEKFTAIQDACDDALRLWQAQLAKTSARLVVISARWELALADPTSGGFKTRQSFLAPPGFDGVPSLELSRRTFDTAFGDLLTALTGAGKAVVVVGQLPMQTTVGIICANRHTDSDEATAEACDATSLDAYRERAEPINSMLASLARERSRVLFIDPSSALCVDRCHLTSVGKVIYANDSHLNARGSTTVLRPYEADIDVLLTPSATAG